MNKKAFLLEIKSLSEAGEFEGYAAVYNNEDRRGDVIQRGAFTRTLQTNGADVPILWQHNMDQPIGVGTLSDSSDGLLIKGQLNLDVTQAREAYSLLKQGAVKGLSIGYDALQWEWVGDVRHLKEIRVWEVSAVTFPANPLAQVISVKALDFHDDVPVVDAEWDPTAAVSRVNLWAGDDAEKKASAYLVDDGGGTYRHLIADVVDGNLVIVKKALEAVAKEVMTAEYPENVKTLLVRYMDKAGIKADKKSVNYERSLRKLIANTYVNISAIKTGTVFEGEQIKLVDTAIEALQGLKAAATTKPEDTKSGETQPDGQAAGGLTDGDSEKLHSLIESMRQGIKSLKGEK